MKNAMRHAAQKGTTGLPPVTSLTRDFALLHSDRLWTRRDAVSGMHPADTFDIRPTDLCSNEGTNSTTSSAVPSGSSARPPTPAGFSREKARDISASLTAILADVFVIYIKTKNFHWHVSGPPFRDHHLRLDQQAAQLFAMTDTLAQRARDVGGATIRSIGQIARLQRLPDNDEDCVDPCEMLDELARDNRVLAANMREARSLCGEAGDVASASVLENWIGEAEQRVRFLSESSRASPKI